MMRNKKVMVALVSLTMLSATNLRAQDDRVSEAEVDPTDTPSLIEPQGGPVENRFRIGLDCTPVSEVLSYQLELPSGVGLLVNDVAEESPAASGGFSRWDIVLDANGVAVREVMDLVKAVNAAGPSEMSLTVVRKGKRQILRVTPEERDEQEISQLRQGLRNRIGGQGFPGLGELEGLPPEFRRQLEQFERIMPFDGPLGSSTFRRILPGIIMDPNERSGGLLQSLPQGVSFQVQVEREGEGPARIHVRRGNESWEVTEDKLEDLPNDIRPLVENMLNGSGTNVPRLVDPNLPENFHSGERVVPRQFDKRFDGLELQLQELQDAVRRIQEDGK